MEEGLKKQTSVWYIAGKLILTLYLYLISYFYTLSYPLSWTSPIRLIVIYLFVHCICEWLGKRKLKLLAVPRKMNWKFGLVIFLLSALILGIYYLAYYPGGIIIDSFNQWYQVQKGFYVDWHPVIHTFLFMKLPSLIWNNLAFVNLLQLIWLSLACAYLGMVMERWGICKVGSAAAIGGSTSDSGICDYAFFLLEGYGTDFVLYSDRSTSHGNCMFRRSMAEKNKSYSYFCSSLCPCHADAA